MKRSTLDKLLSSAGLIVAIVLLAAAGGLFFAHNFIHGQVKEQLAAQKITFPQADSKEILSLNEADREAVNMYAGQQLLTGAQAATYANHYIAAHLHEIAGGKTYAEVSAESQNNPADQKLAGQAQTMFRGETLRGLLLNAYAFDTMATVAHVAAYISLSASAILVVLSALGFRRVRNARSAR